MKLFEQTVTGWKKDIFLHQETIAYYTGADVSTASIAGKASDSNFSFRGLGIQSLTVFEKCQVDVLGNISVVKHEKRMDFSAKKR